MAGLGIVAIVIGSLIIRVLAYRKPPEAIDYEAGLALRNSRFDNAVWCFTGCLFGVVAGGLLIGNIVMNVRDPAARWMGPAVK